MQALAGVQEQEPVRAALHAQGPEGLAAQRHLSGGHRGQRGRYRKLPRERSEPDRRWRWILRTRCAWTRNLSQRRRTCDAESELDEIAPGKTDRLRQGAHGLPPCFPPSSSPGRARNRTRLGRPHTTRGRRPRRSRTESVRRPVGGNGSPKGTTSAALEALRSSLEEGSAKVTAERAHRALLVLPPANVLMQSTYRP